MPGTNVLSQLNGHWLAKIEQAMEYKREHFQRDADQCMAFFDGPYEWLYGLKRQQMAHHGDMGEFIFQGDKRLPRPSICMTVNRCAEVVQLFGPALYHRNPIRRVTGRHTPLVPPELLGDPNDPKVQAMYMPMAQEVLQRRSIDDARAMIFESYQNYTPSVLGLEEEMRACIDETLIKGLGVMWHEVFYGIDSIRMAGSIYDSVDHLVIDPDVERRSEASYIARQYVKPVWQVEDEFGYERGSLKSNFSDMSSRGMALSDLEWQHWRKRGQTTDLIVYWKIWSKIGIGGRLSGIGKDYRDFDMFGDNCCLCVCKGLDHPLNVSKDMLEQPDLIQQAVEWEVPFYADSMGPAGTKREAWPCTFLTFHEKPRSLWPVSHLKPGLGELKFLNWAYSFLASKIRISSRDFVAYKKGLEEEVKRVLESGVDYEMIAISGESGPLDQIVKFLQHPEMNPDIWKVILSVNDAFEKRVGLTELMYGMSENQLRSAAEADIKASNMNVRPDDMAKKVEAMASNLARREAFLARWVLDPQRDIAPILGPVTAYWWEQLISNADPTELLHQLEYRIEAGSARRPNKDRDLANANNSMQQFGQMFYEHANISGNVGPINALISQWCKAQDIDPAKFLLQPPPAPLPEEKPPPTSSKPKSNGAPAKKGVAA